MIECYFLAFIKKEKRMLLFSFHFSYILKKKRKREALVAVKAKSQNYTNGDFFSSF